MELAAFESVPWKRCGAVAAFTLLAVHHASNRACITGLRIRCIAVTCTRATWVPKEAGRRLTLPSPLRTWAPSSDRTCTLFVSYATIKIREDTEKTRLYSAESGERSSSSSLCCTEAGFIAGADDDDDDEHKDEETGAVTEAFLCLQREAPISYEWEMIV